MKKKTYEQPKMKVVQLDHADIICTSGFDNASYQNLEDGEFEW